MNKQLESAQRRILRVTTALEAELGLSGWWDIAHHFVEGLDGDTELDKDGKVTVYKTCAATTTTWEYRSAKITWYLSTVCRIDDDELEWTAVHEYVHVLMAPLATLVPPKDLHGKLEEFVTESLARAIMRARGSACPA